MKKDTMKNTNTQNIDINVKNQLAKLIASENIIVRHNNVKTASFDTKQRILTLPIFKQHDGDVTDMLIAHECAHALWTPSESFIGIDSNELRSYVNVLEDTRIDKLIQKKYPGCVRNYQNGYRILDKRNFFGIIGKDVNKDLMIIDKINLRSKSQNTIGFNFNKEEADWVSKVDGLKTFKDVIALAKEMLDWQKDQVEQMQKLPDFDQLELAKNYDLDDDMDYDDDNSDDNSDQQDDFSDNSDSDQMKSEEKKDENQDGEEQDKNSDNGKEGKEEEDEKADDKDSTKASDGAGGGKLVSITDKTYQDKTQQELVKNDSHGFVYSNFPESNLQNTLHTYKDYLKNMRGYYAKYNSSTDIKFKEWLKSDWKKWKLDNKKTVNYLVKEFEMKKSATAYKRATTDKTGILDPIKLKNYRFSDDIFKRVTMLPDGKNHGMMMLLDWSGSMSDCIDKSVNQIINLVEFCKKVNIPFECYFFGSRNSYQENPRQSFNTKTGDFGLENYNLVNIASHRMKKTELDEGLMYLYSMGQYYHYNYNRGWRRSMTYDDRYNNPAYDNIGMPYDYHLGNTPLNEALVTMNTLIPMFQKKYKVEKLSFITITDGSSNGMRKRHIYSNENMEPNNEYDKNLILVNKKKMYDCGRGYGHDVTAKLLENLKQSYNVNVIGFFLVKRMRPHLLESYVEGDWSERRIKSEKLKADMRKHKCCEVPQSGYNKYFLINGKDMDIENFDISEVEIKKGTASEFKRIFGKSMKNRVVSRMVLNKFIEEVA